MSSNNGVYNSVPLTEKVSGEKIQLKPPKGFGVRHVQAVVLFFSLAVGYALRAHLSISMVAMTTIPSSNTNRNTNVADNSSFTRINNASDFTDILNSVHDNENENDNSTFPIFSDQDYNSLNVSKRDVNDKDSYGLNISKGTDREPNIGTWSVYRKYKWNKATQEMILYAFFVGYTSMMIPIGIVAQKYGGKIPILIALGANGVLSIVSPWVPLFSGWIGMCAVRLLQGMTQSAFYPSIHTLLARWTPISERGRLSTYIYTGSQFGTVVAFQLAGLFAGSPALGWPASFWMTGVASLVAFSLLAWLGAADPEDYSTISDEELAYIKGDGDGVADSNSKQRITPWKEILTSKTVWGIVATQCGSVLGYLLILTQIPLYMSAILGVDIKRNGVFSSLPYIAMYFMCLLFGYLSDYCVNRKILSVANVRRVSNTIGMVVPGLLLVAFSFVNSTLAAVTVLVLCVGLHSGVHVGFHINQIDLAPNFAGSIMALGNMFGNLSSLIAPVLVANIVGDDVRNQQKWQILFIITASIMIISNIIFVIFVKGKIQPWNFYGEIIEIDPEEERNLKEKTYRATKDQNLSIEK